MVAADLHVHTTNSDGVLTLESLPTAAAAASVSAVAITDHDRLHPDLSAPVSRIGDLTVIHGIELRVETADRRIDLLGYGVHRTPALESLIDRLQADRVERGRKIIDCVEDRLDTELPVEPRPGLGRPHVAEAIASVSTYSYTDAFEELIGSDCPCYVPREVPSFETGLDTLESACGLVALAHPYRYDDPAAALERCSELDAVERFYPYAHDIDTRTIEQVMAQYDLLATGGSDAHDETLGVAGLDRERYRRFRAAL